MNSVPEQLKVGLDITAGVTGVGALVGFLTNVFGLIAALGSAIWIWWRLYDRYKNKKESK